MITLYDCFSAPSPRRARILLAEKGIAYETVHVDLRAGEQLGEAYRQVNPQCTVPALRTEDGTVLTDNAAITAYLEARFPQPPLLGETPEQKAEVASWIWRIEFEGLFAIAEAMRNSLPADSGAGAARPHAGRAVSRHVERPPGGPRLHRDRSIQRGRHHRGGGRRLRARGEAEAGRAAPAPVALAGGPGEQAVDVALARRLVINFAALRIA
jgi:glutathione S-transferase